MKTKIIGVLLLIGSLCAAQEIKSNFKISDENVSRKKIQVIGGDEIIISRSNQYPELNNGDIKLEKRRKDGKLVWEKYYGGSGYEYIGSFDRTKDGGFIIIGTTSSFGNGNNDLFLLKTDADGEVLWQKTYGGFFNEYGKYVKSLSNGNYLVKGKQQLCKGENVGNCYDKEWVFEINGEGELLAKK